MEDQDQLRTSDYLDETDIWWILDEINTIKAREDIFEILGCDILPGGVAKLFECIQDWKSSTLGTQAISEMCEREAVIRSEQAQNLLRLKKQHTK